MDQPLLFVFNGFFFLIQFLHYVRSSQVASKHILQFALGFYV